MLLAALYKRLRWRTSDGYEKVGAFCSRNVVSVAIPRSPSAGLMLAAALCFMGAAHAACPSYTILANGTTANAAQVMGNFNYILQCPVFTGNVGIGTGTTPTDLLSIQGDVNSFVGAQIANVHGSGSAGIRLATDAGGATAALLRSFSSGTPVSGLNLPSSTALQTFGANGLTLGSVDTTDTTAILRLATSNIVRMTIDTAGGVGIGAAAPLGVSLFVQGIAGGTATWQVLSDARLKKNIIPIDGALGIVEALQGVRFDWRMPDERTIGKSLKLPMTPQIGFVAQDVAKVLPEAVTVSADRASPMSIQESKIIPVLVEAVKEQAAQIAQLRGEIAALKHQRAAQTYGGRKKTISQAD